MLSAKEKKEKKDIGLKIVEDEKLFQANEWIDKGRQYTWDGKYDAAIDAFTKSITLNPDNAIGYYKRGGIYYKERKQHDKAIEDITVAINKNNRFVVAYHDCGLAYVGKGQYNSAISDFSKVISLDKKYVDAYFERGHIYAAKGIYDRATEDYDKAASVLNRGVSPALGKINKGWGWNIHFEVYGPS